MMFSKTAKVKKGLEAVSDGIEGTPVVISETANARSSQGELSKQLSSLFTLSRRNVEASEETDADKRKPYGR